MIDAIFRARMYDVINLYEEPCDPKRPLINLDEKPKQLFGEKRMSIPLKWGSPEKSFYETFDKDEAERILSKNSITHQSMQAGSMPLKSRSM